MEWISTFFKMRSAPTVWASCRISRPLPSGQLKNPSLFSLPEWRDAKYQMPAYAEVCSLVEGGRLDRNWSWWRHLLSWWANAIYARIILGLGVKDATAGFKCWRRATLEAILAYPIRSNGYVFQVEMAYLAQRLGFHTQEIPIYFEDRRAGRSKMSNRIKIEAAWRTWLLRWRYRQVRPLARPAPAPAQSPNGAPGRS